jgi:hypothetical protein
MLSHFLRAWANSRKPFNVLQEYGAGETPQALAPRRLTATPAESEVPRDRQRTPVPAVIYSKKHSLVEYKSTGPFETAKIINNRPTYPAKKFFAGF